MSKDKFRHKSNQSDKYTFHDEDKGTGKHETSFYIPDTGVTAYHGENTSQEGKDWLGDQVRDSSMYDVNPGKK